jgi:trehalose-6-phosphatase
LSLTDERAEKLEGFFRALGAAKARPLLLLDYDGTLAGFRVDRFKARLWAGVRELLESIQSQGKTRMAVITGRPACEIEPMLGLTPPLEVWGLHGAERLYPDGRRVLETAPGESSEKLDVVRAQLKIDSLGGLYEDKDNAAVMHWRGYSAEKAKAIRARWSCLSHWPSCRGCGCSTLTVAWSCVRAGTRAGRLRRSWMRARRMRR